MKISKLILFAFLSITIISCGSDDSDDNTSQRVVVKPTITLDIDEAILRNPGDDITDLISFGQPSGVSTFDYTVELKVGDILKLKQPMGLDAGDIMYYSRFDFFIEDPFDFGNYIPVDENEVYGVYLDIVQPVSFDSPSVVEDPFQPGTYISDTLGLKSIDAENDDLEWKYDIQVVLYKDGSFYGYYTIDPKIRIKGRTLN